jgi:hypothetical protein
VKRGRRGQEYRYYINKEEEKLWSYLLYTRRANLLLNILFPLNHIWE